MSNERGRPWGASTTRRTFRSTEKIGSSTPRSRWPRRSAGRTCDCALSPNGWACRSRKSALISGTWTPWPTPGSRALGRRCCVRCPPGFAGLPARQRLETLLLRWFDVTSAHRRVSVQMLAAKLWPFHPHHWAPLIFNLSRTILWLRDAAALDAGSPRRELEEVGLTWLFLLTLLVWAGDESEGQARTRRFLRRRLADADVLMALLFGPQPSTNATATR